MLSRISALALLGLSSACATAAPRETEADGDSGGLSFDVPVFRRDQFQVDEWLSRATVGLLDHDVGATGVTYESGTDTNVEFGFESGGDFLEAIYSPEPILGLSVNSDGGTSQAYLGLSWLGDLLGDRVFGGISLGLSVHDGKLQTQRLDSKALGSRVLFRESIELGVRTTERQTLSLMLDHVSNASLAEVNEGLDTFGIRYGVRF